MQQNLLLREHPRAVRAPLPATLQYACHVYLDGKQSAGKHEVDADQHFLKESIMNKKRDRLESGLLCNSYPTHIEESFHRSQEEEWKKLRVQPRSAVCISKLQCQTRKCIISLICINNSPQQPAKSVIVSVYVVVVTLASTLTSCNSTSSSVAFTLRRCTREFLTIGRRFLTSMHSLITCGFELLTTCKKHHIRSA